MLVAAVEAFDVAGALARHAADGWARLGTAASPAMLDALRARADALMTTRAPGLFYQHDSPSGAYQDLRFGDGWVGPSPAYRKLEGLEHDAVFRRWIENPLFARVAAAAIPGEVVVCRAVLWTKAPGGGTHLPWHQDGGAFWGLSAQPTVTLWTALDDAPVASGCMELIPGSHAAGLATPQGGTIPDELTAPRAAEVIAVPAVAGEVVLLHNLIWHRSGRNATARPRRALSLCLMSAGVRCTRKRRAPRRFAPVFRAATDPAGAGPGSA